MFVDYCSSTVINLHMYMYIHMYMCMCMSFFPVISNHVQASDPVPTKEEKMPVTHCSLTDDVYDCHDTETYTMISNSPHSSGPPVRVACTNRPFPLPS